MIKNTKVKRLKVKKEYGKDLPGREKNGIVDELLIFVKTPAKLGVGTPGIENTVDGMIDCMSIFKLVFEGVAFGVTETLDDVEMLPPDCSPGWAI